MFSVTEQNVDDLGVFDVEMIDWTLAVCTGCMCECVCERACVCE